VEYRAHEIGSTAPTYTRRRCKLGVDPPLATLAPPCVAAYVVISGEQSSTPQLLISTDVRHVRSRSEYRLVLERIEGTPLPRHPWMSRGSAYASAPTTGAAVRPAG
jgi:hypothetical protein